MSEKSPMDERCAICGKLFSEHYEHYRPAPPAKPIEVNYRDGTTEWVEPSGEQPPIDWAEKVSDDARCKGFEVEA